MNIEIYNEINNTIVKAFTQIKILHYINPINIEEQKQLFLANKIKNPTFKYRKLEHNPKEIKKSLQSLEIPDTELGKLFQERKDIAILRNEIVANLGDKEIVTKNSMRINKSPTEKLVKKAKEIIEKTADIPQSFTITAKELKQEFIKTLKKYNLNDWTVELTEKIMTTVYPGHKQITICKNRLFSKNELNRLPLHEIGIHVIRAVNGFNQPFKFFGIGLPNYLPTEEGLTAYLEEKMNLLPPNRMRFLAARVIAVDSMVKNNDFRTTFNIFKKYKYNDNDAWLYTLRAYRGGGYAKDHVYLQGYLEIKDFVNQGGNLKALYIGKIGIEHLPLCKQLLKENILKKPKILPDFL